MGIEFEKNHTAIFICTILRNLLSRNTRTIHFFVTSFARLSASPRYHSVLSLATCAQRDGARHAPPARRQRGHPGIILHTDPLASDVRSYMYSRSRLPVPRYIRLHVRRRRSFVLRFRASVQDSSLLFRALRDATRVKRFDEARSLSAPDGCTASSSRLLNSCASDSLTFGGSFSRSVPAEHLVKGRVGLGIDVVVALRTAQMRHHTTMRRWE